MNEHLPPDLLSALVDGEVEQGERRVAHEHLRDCDECRTRMREYTNVQRLVSGLPRASAPEDLVAEALAYGRGPIGAARLLLHGRRRPIAAAAAAAAVLVTLGGIAAPADESPPPVDVFVARHAGVSASTGVTGHVIFAVTGR